MRRMRQALATTVLAAALPACIGQAGSPGDDGRAAVEEEIRLALEQERAATAAALDGAFARIEERADSFDAVLHPLPLLRPAEEAELRRYLNPQQLDRARQLGVRPGRGAVELERLVAAGELVRLDDSNEHWVVRELDYSVPLVTPDAAALLREVGERFHARLADLGLPPYRLEVTSVLRSAEDQARLREVNPNAVATVSTHELGTTIDIAYNAYAAPARPIVELDPGESGWLEPFLERFAALAAEVVAARRAREIQAVLGHVLMELQREGKVMVTLERLQPVYHLTVARRLAEER